MQKESKRHSDCPGKLLVNVRDAYDGTHEAVYIAELKGYTWSGPKVERMQKLRKWKGVKRWTGKRLRAQGNYTGKVAENLPGNEKETLGTTR